MNRVLLYLSALTISAALAPSCKKQVDKTESHIPTPKVLETEPAILTPVHTAINGGIKGFYEALPAHYSETEELYPVLLCFHGGGQYGDGNSQLPSILNDGVPKLFSEKKFPPTFTVNGERFSFIMIAPQFSREPFDYDLKDLINYTKGHYRVDTTRIYLTGYSLGAMKLTDYAAIYPYSVAAITAMGGTLNFTDLAAKCKVMVDAKLPVWQFHNVDDSMWDYHESEKFVETFNSFSPAIPARLTLFDVGQARFHHDCWTRATDPAYVGEDEKNIYEWMLQYHR